MSDYTGNVELEQRIREKATGWGVGLQSVPTRLVVTSSPRQARVKTILERSKELFSSYVSLTLPKIWEGAQLSPVKHQGKSYACTAFAITSALEDQLLLWRAGQAKRLSALHAHICIGGKDIEESWDPGYALETLQNALIAEQSNLEAAWTPELCSITNGSVGLRYKPIHDHSTAKAALANGPIIAEMDLWQDLHSFYRSGIYRHVDGDYYGRHTVEVVGFNNVCWVIKNSYGPKWGEDGYARIALNECNLFQYQAYQVYPA